jgi:iron complex transport system substrate-binding protein
MSVNQAAARMLPLLLCTWVSTAPAQERVLTDMAGRKVAVPLHIQKVYCMSPVCTVLVYTLAPDLLAGWNYQPDAGEMKWIVDPYRKLPVLGGWFGKNNTGNLEEIVKAHPDVLMSVGDPLALSVAERVQEQTHLPVFVGDGSLKNLDKLYLAVGDLLGRQARAAELADYCRKVVREVEAKVAAIPLGRRRRVYYAEGPTGLETDPRGSAHSEAIDFAGGLNVAQVPAEGGYGHIPVSMEQVLRWDPEIVISGYDHNSSPGEFYRSVWQDPLWKQVKAVKNRAVFETPQYPFNWIDRPPSVNRIIGIKWLANLFYPELFHYDMRTETRDFYLRFYHRKPSDAELAEVLAQAVQKP